MTKRFELIPGGKEDKPVSKVSQEASLQDRIANQERLNPDETRALLADIRDMHIRSLREKIAKYSDRILTDEDLLFIRRYSLALVAGDAEAKEELYAKFPDLVGYFEDIMEKLNLKESE